MDSGTIVAGRFRIEGPPAVGGMGEVHLATDLSTDRRVALKLLRWHSAALDARFAREATVLAELSHPGIVGYVAHGLAADGNAYLAMEWIDGELLSHRLRRGALTVADTLALGSAVAEALAVAHGRHIVHRDLKPGNLLCEAGEPRRAKILDFGLARNDAASLLGVTRTGELAGTPGYMAPEQARGLHDVDARADVYSLGCVLYECLSGRPAFTGEHVFAVLAKILVEEVPRVSEVAPGVPAALDDLVMRALAKDPRDRPVDAAELLAELQRVIESAGAAPSGDPPAQALGRGEQRVLCVILAAGEAPPDNPDEAPTVSERAQQATTTSLTSAVKAHGGVLDRVAGGHLVVTFQGAGTATDLAARAGRCALAVAGLLPDTQVAIATGRGVARERVLVGAVIDAAASLIARAAGDPAAASPGSEAGAIGTPLAAWRPVRLDEVTAGLLDSRFELGAVDTGTLLLGYTDSREAERPLLGQPTPFVGRDRELTNLLAIVEECCDEPQAQAVLIIGAAGAGKSRLRTEFVRRMLDVDDRVRVWTGRGDPMSAGAPLAMLAQMIRREAGIRYGEEARPARRKLRARVGRHVAADQAERVSEFLGEMCGIPFDDERRPELRAARRDASVMGDQLRRAWEDLIAAECAAAPLVIVLEDLHWGDLPTVRFVDATLRTLARQPLMVLALARPEVHELFPDLWTSRGLQIVTLRPLTERAARKLVEQTLGDGAGDTAVRRIVEQAAGNPFYLEELIRAAAVGQDQPGTVLAMLGARLEALPGERRRLLRAASILGEAFWPAALGALVDRDPAWIASALESLVEQEWLGRRSESVRADYTEYAFRHALVREAAYAMLTDEDRALGHRLAAAWLERAGDADAMTVGEHFERGGEPGRAVRWYARAARQAMDGTDLTAAVERARRGLACAAADGDRDAHRDDLGPLRLAIAEANRWGGNNVEAEREGLAALAVLPEGSEAWYTTLVQVVIAAARVDHIDRVIAIAEQLRATAVDAAGAAPWVRAAEQAAMRLIFAGDRLDLVDALRALIEARVPLGVRDDPSLPARAAMVNAYHADYRGDLVAAERYHGEAVALFDRLGYQRVACAQRHDLGLMSLTFGDWARGEEALRGALADAERLGMGGQASTARQNLAYALGHLGRLAEAEAFAQEAIAAFAAIGDRRMLAGSHQYLAIVRLLGDDVTGAEASVREALVIETRPSPSRAMSLAVLAECRLRQDDAGEALTAAGDALHIMDNLGGSVPEGEARIRLVWAQSLRASGEPEAAAAAMRAAVERIEARAALIDDPARRATFLAAIPEHATTLRLARDWDQPAREALAGDMTEPG